MLVNTGFVKLPLNFILSPTKTSDSSRTVL